MNASRMEDKINNQLETQLNDLSDQIQSDLKSGRYNLAELQKMVLDKSKEAAQTTDQYVRDNPWAAMGIAAGVGVAIGMLLNRK